MRRVIPVSQLICVFPRHLGENQFSLPVPLEQREPDGREYFLLLGVGMVIKSLWCGLILLDSEVVCLPVCGSIVSVGV